MEKNKRTAYGSNIKLPPLEDLLFSTEQDRQDAMLEKVQNIPLEQLFSFPDHPYQVRDDDEMQKMVESVQQYGVLTPLIARPHENGGYEIIAGHRRKRAGELAGRDTMPVIVREMDDDTAVIAMVDSNCQRENVSAIEKAKAYKMKMDALKRQGKRNDLTSSQVGTKLRADEKVAQDAGESRNQIQRYIRLNELIPELQEMVEEKKLKFNPAVELSYLTPEEQEQFRDYIGSEGCTPSLSQAQQLKAASREKSFSEDKLKSIMSSHTPSILPMEQQISIPLSRIERFFPRNATAEQIIIQIIRMLEARQKARQRDFER
ncbi:MAG: ParB/RepB/Spo0J family partition protein [Subdoligranulum sp.]|nr:ParB/RepB/Spo0J family partition protein [Subdoligranulum sp.]